MSAHRTPQLATEFASSAADRGLQIIIAAAGGAAILAGVIAAHTTLPVLGVADEERCAQWHRFVTFDGANAGWHPGRDVGNWKTRRHQCGAVRDCDLATTRATSPTN